MAYPPSAVNRAGWQQFQSTESFVPFKQEDSFEPYHRSPGFEDDMVKANKMSKKRKGMIIGGAVLLVAAIAGGVSAGVAIMRSHSTRSNAANGGIGSGSASGSASDFQQNPALHQSFAGLCYTPPFAANYPTCGDTIEAVTTDIQLMSQLTKTLRLYGSDCNTSSLVLDAIQRANVDMTVFLGIYFDNTPGTFQRQLGEIETALTTFGSDHVDGIVVGNEYILNAFNDISPSGTPTAAATAAQASAQKVVIANIATTRKAIDALNLKNSPKIGTGDAGSMITKQLGAASDFIFANVHAFFSDNVITAAPEWTWDYLETGPPANADDASNKPIVYAAEVGWPSGADNNGSLSLNASAASMENMQYMLDNYVCAANTNQTRYFWFEAFDEEWKVPLFGGAEGHWGLFNS